MISIKLSEIQDNQFFRLYAYNSNEDQISFVQSAEDGSGCVFDFLLPSGISFFKIYDYSNNPSTLAYNLELKIDTSDGCELNNSFETACLVEPDTILHSQLFGYNSDLGGDDADYYEVEAGIILNQCFTISNVQPGQNIRLYVYDEDHNQIGFEHSPEEGSGFLYCLDLGMDAFYFILYDYNKISSNEPLTIVLVGISALSVSSISLEEDLISVFPNPNSGKFSVSIPETASQIQILNSIGQTVQSEILFRQEKLEFELGETGIYFIRIKTEKGIRTRKLVVTHHD